MSEDRRIGQSTLRLIKGDITELEIDGFVYYARHDLTIGAGFGTAISTRGGPTIQKELTGLAPLATGQVVVTLGGKLKPRHIIHAVGPRFQEEDIEGKLRITMRNALAAAEEKGFETIAFPAMGVGFYGVPLDLSARVMLETVTEHLEGVTRIKEVIFCVLDSREYGPFRAHLAGAATAR